MKPQIIILLGPYGAGKSAIGGVLEDRFSCRFIDVEDLLLKKYRSYDEFVNNKECFYSDLLEMIRTYVKSHVNTVVFEQVGSGHAEKLIDDLVREFDVWLVKVAADEDTCLLRVKTRQSRDGVTKSGKDVSESFLRFRDHISSRYEFDLVIENDDISLDEIAEKFEMMFAD